MAIRTVDFMAVSLEINMLAQRLGNIEGQARERGYPLLADAKRMDCSGLVLSALDKNEELLGQMRGELDDVYLKLRTVSTNIEQIAVPELKGVFEAQVKDLHEKRGVLNNSFSVFRQLLSFHALIEETAKGISHVKGQVALFTSGKIGIENWETINNSIEDLFLRLRIAFPEGGTSCQLHDRSKLIMQDELNRCRLDLDFKKAELNQESVLKCKATLEELLPLLDALRKTKASDQDIEKVQKLFMALPLDLRAIIFGRRNFLPEDQVQNTVIVFTPPERGAPSEVWVEVRGLSYYDSQRNLGRFEKSVNELLDKSAQARQTVVSEREKARDLLDNFVAELPEEEIKNPKLLLEVLSKICAENPSRAPSTPAIQKIMAAAEKGFDALDNEQFDLSLRNVPVLNSVKAIRDQVEAYQAARMYNDSQKERLVAALLEAAESRGNVALNVDNGVYYWVWFLAHEKDPSAGGDQFGKFQAPKDLDRLLEALKRAMPPEQAPIPAPSVQRNLSPAPVVLLKSSAQNRLSSSPGHRPARPSEVKAAQQGNVVSSPVSVASNFTEVKVRCKVPLGHFLSICGEGGGLSWTQGKQLKKLSDDTYVHRMEGVLGKVDYKILLDGVEYEGGGNRSIEAQKSEEIVPNLQMPKLIAIIDFAPTDGKLFACGTGPGMTWNQDKKVELKKIDGNFVIESKVDTGDFEFKVLLSDNRWSNGANFKVQNGKLLQVKPQF